MNEWSPHSMTTISAKSSRKEGCFADGPVVPLSLAAELYQKYLEVSFPTTSVGKLLADKYATCREIHVLEAAVERSLRFSRRSDEGLSESAIH